MKTQTIQLTHDELNIIKIALRVLRDEHNDNSCKCRTELQAQNHRRRALEYDKTLESVNAQEKP